MSTIGTICILDDERLVLDALALGLRDHGYKALAASDIASAITLIRQSAPLAVLSDLQMPGLADAAPVAMLRACFPTLPLIAMSGSPELETLALANGANAFLAKPMRAARIADCLDRLLHPPGGANIDRRRARAT